MGNIRRLKAGLFKTRKRGSFKEVNAERMRGRTAQDKRDCEAGAEEGGRGEVVGGKGEVVGRVVMRT